MAEKKKTTEVLIDGKVYCLQGADPQYLQKVSGYLNSKIAEVRKSASWRNLDADYKVLLLELNLADDYFRVQEEKEALEKKAEELERQLYAARHDIVSTKLKLENSLKQQSILETRVDGMKNPYGAQTEAGGEY